MMRRIQRRFSFGDTNISINIGPIDDVPTQRRVAFVDGTNVVYDDDDVRCIVSSGWSISRDEDGNVSVKQPDGTMFAVSEDGDVRIQGANGTLTIGEDGDIALRESDGRTFTYSDGVATRTFATGESVRIDDGSC